MVKSKLCLASECSAAVNFIDTGCLYPSGSFENPSNGFYTPFFFFFLMTWRPISKYFNWGDSCWDTVVQDFFFLSCIPCFVFFFLFSELHTVLLLFVRWHLRSRYIWVKLVWRFCYVLLEGVRGGDPCPRRKLLYHTQHRSGPIGGRHVFSALSLVSSFWAGPS